MPIDKIEKHPYLSYINHHLDADTKYSGLIVGSFPIYAVTDTLDENLNVAEQRFSKEANMRFFYGSKKSSFWQYCSKAFGNDISHQISTEKAINFLNQNSLIITDSLDQTNRKEIKSEDTNLFHEIDGNSFVNQNLKVNYGIRSILKEHDKISSIFFTSQDVGRKSPYGWFKMIFDHSLVELENRPFGKICNIQGKDYKCFFLPTPKPRGMHFTDTRRAELFVNYLMSTDQNFYDEIDVLPMTSRSAKQKARLSELRLACLVETYKQALVNNNIDFDGTVS